MLIKSVTKNGEAVPMSPAECLEAALIRAAKKEASDKFVFWVLKGSIKEKSFNFHFTKKEDNQWEAQAEGTVELGKTELSSDRFFSPVRKNFKIEYKTVKDELGQHDIEVTSSIISDLESQTDIMNRVVDNITKPLVQKATTEKSATVDAKPKT